MTNHDGDPPDSHPKSKTRRSTMKTLTTTLLISLALAGAGARR